MRLRNRGLAPRLFDVWLNAIDLIASRAVLAWLEWQKGLKFLLIIIGSLAQALIRLGKLNSNVKHSPIPRQAVQTLQNTMLSLRIDQFEFDDPASEEALEIDISRHSKFPNPDVCSFVGATVGVKAVSELAEPKPFYSVPARSRVGQYIKRFANIEIPLHAEWPTYALSTDSWDQTHLVICAPGIFIRYQWSTSA